MKLPLGFEFKEEMAGTWTPPDGGPERTIRFSLRALKDDEERAEFEGFRKKESADTAQGFGTFGDLLKSRKHK